MRFCWGRGTSSIAGCSRPFWMMRSTYGTDSPGPTRRSAPPVPLRTLLAATLIARTRRLAGTFLAGKLLAGTLLARKRVAGAHHADAADTTGTVDATGGAEMSFHRLFAWPSCTHGPATAM